MTTTMGSCLSKLMERVLPCWFRALAWLDPAAAEAQRKEFDFNQVQLPLLISGGAFLLVTGVDDNDESSSQSSSSSASASSSSSSSNAQPSATSLLNFVEKNVTSFAAAAKSSLLLKKNQPQPNEHILLRLVRPKSTLDTPVPSMMDSVGIQLSRFANALAPAGTDQGSNQLPTTTALMWTSLALEQNMPRVSGRVSLHKVQTVREKGPGFILSDHNGVVLLEVKVAGEAATQVSLEANKWVGAIQSAMTCLAAQIEEEAVASRGSSYREQRLEQLRLREEERKRQKAKLGVVGMTYTAQVMASR